MASEFTAPGRLTSEPDLRPAPLDFADPVAGEEVIALSYAGPVRESDDYAVGPVASVGLQVAHRAGSLALILLLGGIGALVAGKHAGQLLFWTVGVASIGLLSASVALLKIRGRSGTEARNVAFFNAAVFVTAMILFLMNR